VPKYALRTTLPASSKRPREGPRNTRSQTRANSLLGVSPEAAEEEVKDHEPTEEENGD
jgi:hypothetical protein